MLLQPSIYRSVGSTPMGSLILLPGLLLHGSILGWGLLSGVSPNGNITPFPIFLLRGSSPRDFLFFRLVHHLLWFSLVRFLLVLLLGSLCCHRWSFRYVLLRSVEHLCLLVSRLFLLRLFDDSLCGVICATSLVIRPCHMLLGTHMLAVLARLRW